MGRSKTPKATVPPPPKKYNLRKRKGVKEQPAEDIRGGPAEDPFAEEDDENSTSARPTRQTTKKLPKSRTGSSVDPKTGPSESQAGPAGEPGPSSGQQDEPTRASGAKDNKSGTPDLSKVPRQWSGWCEIESDPALFNVILKDWGVEGAKVYEVFSLDDAMLADIPRPVFGLIFLFRWMDHGDEQATSSEERGRSSKIWFANQVPDNACATIALLNIIMNINQVVDTGEHLRQFKEYTSDMSPAIRGLAIDNFRFIKDIHNSFGRKIDMLADDYEMAEKATESTSKKRKRRGFEEEAALHFNAFLPVDGELYKLDGLDEEPYSLGPINPDDWMSNARATLEERMMACVTAEHEFAVLAVAKDPLFELEKKLERAQEGLKKLADRIKEIDPSWTEIDAYVEGEIDELIRDDGITDILASEQLDRLLEYHQALRDATKRLNSKVQDDRQSYDDDEKKAKDRRVDFEPAIRYWVSRLAEKGRLKEMLDWADQSRH